jgi:acetoin utilization deacetylase AcuC-like enzyme
MFRGRLVPCHENPSRLDYVMSELQRRPVGVLRQPGEADLARCTACTARPTWIFWPAPGTTGWPEPGQCRARHPALDLAGARLRHEAPSTNFTARLGRFSFDSGSPITAGTWTAALAGARCAIEAAQAVAAWRAGGLALTRPPGHHAGPDFFGGYCFINNAAVAAQTCAMPAPGAWRCSTSTTTTATARRPSSTSVPMC